MKNEIDVVGAFKTYDGAAKAAEQLVAEGFATRDVSVVVNEDARQHFLTLKKGNKGMEGAAAGGAVGGVSGAVIVALVGAATVAIPGLGLAVAGPIAAAFAGAGAGAAAGGVVGGLVGMGISEHEAKVYDKALRAGGMLVAVRVTSKQEAARARKVLDDFGALKTESEVGLGLRT